MENTYKTRFDKERKKNFKKYISWACLALLVLVLSVMPMLAKNEAEEDGPVASILSGTVQTGSITTAIHGGGTLSAENAEDVTVPADVKITEFLVKNGDEVKEGDPVASVDKVSVMNAIVEVTETMEYLQEQIQSTRSETVSSTVKAIAGGLVKKVYAEAGDSVQDVMLEHGALAVLSLDGKMAVEIQRDMDEILTGDSVIVTLSDGTEITGRVESNLNDIIVITVEDDGYAIGEKVIVTTEGGERVGTGQLYIHNAWKATAFTGTISTVHAKADSTVYSGSSLFTLKDTDFTAQMEYLATQHREYEELLQKLCDMYDSGILTAPCDGVISGVDKNSTHLLASEEGEYQVELLEADTMEKNWTVMLLSNVVTCTGDANCQLDHELEHLEGCIGACDRSASCDAKVHRSDCILACDKAFVEGVCDATVHYKACIEACGSATEEKSCPADTYHKLNCIESCVTSNGSTDCPATGAHHADCIEKCDKSETCPGGKNHHSTCASLCTAGPDCNATTHKAACPLNGMIYTAYAAMVQSAGTTELNVIADTATVYTVAGTQNGWVLDKSLKTDSMSEKLTIPNVSNIQCNQGDVILVMTGTTADGSQVNRIVVYRESSTGSNAGGQSGFPGGSGMNFSGMLSGMMSGMTGGATGTTQELFDLEGDVLLTVTPRSTVSLTITVDEQDISKLSIGQSAEVKVEAIKGETFEAEVTELGVTGTNSGGSSKFTVKLEMDMTEDMLDGMSATASIPLYTKMDILTIPVAALVEDGAKTVVYTATNKETGVPASPVEVETGISDGEYAEVLSGLKSGDTFYYSYYDTLELSTAVEPGMMSPFGR